MTIKEYLSRQNINYQERNGELITHCFFGDCDKDSRGSEAHLYIHSETGLYDCKKCGEKGNHVNLARHFGDNPRDIFPELYEDSPAFKPTKKKEVPPPPPIDYHLIGQWHQALPARIRSYLNQRGITDDLIAEHRIGWGEFYGKFWIVIPIPNREGSITLLKLRRDPEDNITKDKMMVWPKGAHHEIFGWEMLKDNVEMVVVCEGEFDRLILIKHGIPAVTSTGGCKTFKKEWLPYFRNIKKVYVCYDTDDEGKEGAQKLINSLLPSYD